LGEGAVGMVKALKTIIFDYILIKIVAFRKVVHSPPFHREQVQHVSSFHNTGFCLFVHVHLKVQRLLGAVYMVKFANAALKFMRKHYPKLIGYLNGDWIPKVQLHQHKANSL
jgi:hypothetical protein